MTEKATSSDVAAAAFTEALERMKQSAPAVTPGNAAFRPGAGSIEALIDAFENAAQQDESGVEFWLARDLARLLDYADFRNFGNIVEKAKAACTNSGQAVADHFVDVTEMVAIGSGAEREVEDVRLTRYACYLLAQNGDARKKPVAFAQTYFAIQTRRQELRDEAEAPLLSDAEKRVLLREEIKTHNKHLAGAAKAAGVERPVEYAVFQNWGYKGLYGGLDKTGIQRAKGLSKSQDILDHMGSTELAANLFRATQTEEKLRRDQVRGREAANRTHLDVGRKVRQTIQDIGGVMPERLPTEEDVKKVQRRLKRSAREIE